MFYRKENDNKNIYLCELKICEEFMAKTDKENQELETPLMKQY